MQTTLAHHRSHPAFKLQHEAVGHHTTSAEINAYLAARDLYLREAEKSVSKAALQRAHLANELAEACLRPVRSPYQSQGLPQAQAARERQRCKVVEVRLTELGARASGRHLSGRRAA